tara:strand:- start:3467 stop:4501 length:1035 start_codon:yes stop_codon:yes gene_type:complete
MKSSNRADFFIESLVVVLVVFSAFSLYISDEATDVKELELTLLSGEIELSTRDSMDAFGLQDFNVGAVASLNLSAKHVVSHDCKDCNMSTRGVTLHGEVIITQLQDQQDRFGRIEGSLNFTHIMVFSAANYIDQERINFAWSAGDIASSWTILINHNPPRWLPNYDITTLFIETTQGLESRSGPEVLIKNPTEEKRVIYACLPDSFLCRSSSADAVLVATYSNEIETVLVDQTASWEHNNLAEYPTNNSTEEFPFEILQLDNVIPNEHGFTPWHDTAINTVTSYNITDDEARFMPLSAWFYSINMVPLEFNIRGKSLVHISSQTADIYNILNPDNSLSMGLVIY